MDQRIIKLSRGGFINWPVLLTGSITAAINREKRHWIINSFEPQKNIQYLKIHS
jgi:hypothetical protein